MYIIQLCTVFVTLSWIEVVSVESACFRTNDDCPNENVTFWLYSKATRDKPLLLDPLNLNPWDFKPTRPIKILIHGYTGSRDFAPNSHIRPVLLDYADVYVISIDYGPLVPEPCYIQAVQNLPLVSKCLAQLIDNLNDRGIVQNEQIHLIGFSLGGQVAGQTANYVKRKLKRITGLDPAKPLFMTSPLTQRLDKNDADFVDVIHTDVFLRGMLRNMGHVDFYPNIGPLQPGCLEQLPNDPSSCNHERASILYAESIKTNVGFWARQCTNWLLYAFNLCPIDAEETLMGYAVNKNARGTYFLRTADKPPYALGINTIANINDTKLAYKFFDVNQEINDFEPQLRQDLLSYEDLLYYES